MIRTRIYSAGSRWIVQHIDRDEATGKTLASATQAFPTSAAAYAEADALLAEMRGPRAVATGGLAWTDQRRMSA